MNSKFKKDWGDVMKKIQSKGSPVGRKDERYFKVDLGDTGTADVTIRFLPSKDTDTPWVNVSNHGPRGVGGWTSIPCNKAIGKKCIICNYVWGNWKKGDDVHNKPYKNFMVNNRYLMNILVIKDNRHPENEGKVFLYEFGNQIFEKFEEKHKEFEGNGKEVYIWDWMEGVDFRLKAKEKSFTGNDGNKVTVPNFETAYFVDDTSAVGTEEYMEKIYDKMYNLSEFIDPSIFLSDDEIIAKIADVTGVDISSKGSTPAPARYTPTPKEKVESPKNIDKNDDDDDSFVLDDDDDDSDSFFNDLK